MNASSPALLAMIHWLKSLAPAPRPRGTEPWSALITRIRQPGLVHDIDERTYQYFLEILPPLWVGIGGFAFAEGDEPARLFWSEEQSFRVRQLTAAEHATFCGLAGLPPRSRDRSELVCTNCG